MDSIIKHHFSSLNHIKNDFRSILIEKIFSKTINFRRNPFFAEKGLISHRAKQRKATKPSFLENSAFSASKTINRWLKKVEEKKLSRFEKVHFFEKKFFFENFFFQKNQIFSRFWVSFYPFRHKYSS